MLEYVDHGIRLSPRDPETSIFLLLKGWAYLVMEHDDEALVWLRRAAAASPEIPTILAALTSVLALTGQDAEARATLARVPCAACDADPNGRAVGLPARRQSRVPEIPSAI